MLPDHSDNRELIIKFAVSPGCLSVHRVVVTNDRDFRGGHLLSGSPRRLLVVATGNITNAACFGRQR